MKTGWLAVLLILSSGELARAGELLAPLAVFPNSSSQDVSVLVTSQELKLDEDQQLAQLENVKAAFRFEFTEAVSFANIVVTSPGTEDTARFQMRFRVPFSQESVEVAAAAVSSKVDAGSKSAIIATPMSTDIDKLVLLNQRARLVFRDSKEEIEGNVRNPNADDIRVAFVFVRTATSLGQLQFVVADSETRDAVDFLEQRTETVPRVDAETKADVPELIKEFRQLENNFRQKLVDAAVAAINDDQARGCELAKQLISVIGVGGSNQSYQNISNYTSCLVRDAAETAALEARALEEKLRLVEEQARQVLDANLEQQALQAAQRDIRESVKAIERLSIF